ncbi:Protein FAR1-RELATED SEQUENCE 5 [Abeliophyllum distichum]|uniref:Protein FAR1-RELATED SEQUENCE 5 n=1 Tax=Abeliophyllum distichum TaxID=126358 RepID=A0ABD1RFB6_9LAMI
MSRKDVVPRTGKRNRGHVRCGCNARLSVVKQQTCNGWVVSTFVKEHNHPLATPSRVQLLKSHRGVSKTKKALVQQFSEANIPTCQQIRLLEIDAGGPSSLGYMEKDIRNYYMDGRHEMLGHDAETLIDHFTFEKEKNPNFVFDYETDDENKFVRCFWADCESRRSYAYFGDVVVFDTTYNTNRYSMVFGPFVGVNHHGQTVIFRCGLLSDETTESFVLLFTKFIEAMPNHTALGVIITDQDAAITRAISIVLPSTLHRFCIWHILNKFSEKMNVVLYNDQYHRLVHIIKQSESPAEFEQQWIKYVVLAASDLVDEGSLTDAQSTFLLSEFQNLRIRVKDIDTSGDVSMSKNRNKSVEDTQVICDPNPVRAKGCGKRLKSRKEKALFQSNRQCRTCGTSGHDRRTCSTLQNSLDNTNQPQYSQDSLDQQYHALDPQYAYHTPDSQYVYHAPNLQYAYHTPDPQYAYHAPNPQYSIIGSNNASYSLDPREYDARYNPRH